MENYTDHECRRICEYPPSPKTCNYNFTVEWFYAMSKACYGCPFNLTDCERPHCIPLNGVPRAVSVVNRMFPGPSVEVRSHQCYTMYSPSSWSYLMPLDYVFKSSFSRSSKATLANLSLARPEYETHWNQIELDWISLLSCTNKRKACYDLHLKKNITTH